MKYISIDIETTGLDPKKHDIIQFAAVLDDLKNPRPLSELPRIQVYFLKKEYTGTAKALSMHKSIFEKIESMKKSNLKYDPKTESHLIKLKILPLFLRNFLTKNGVEEKNNKIVLTPAGKNVSSFDMAFLKTQIKDWAGISFRQRAIDPTILFYEKEDRELPNSERCMERAGIPGGVAHTALEDALMVVKLIRKKLL